MSPSQRQRELEWAAQRFDWDIYLYARQLWIQTGDTDALANMIAHVTERDGPIPAQLPEIAWRTPVGPDIGPVTPADLVCY
jgi:hypothetical protein